MKQPSRVPGLCEVQLLELSHRETDNELLNIEDRTNGSITQQILCNYFMLMSNTDIENTPVNESFQ